MLYYLEYETKVDAAHSLPNYNGPCKNIHGHTWRIKVGMWASELNEQGMVCDFREIKDIIHTLDHRYLNDITPTPTAELLGLLILKWFQDHAAVKKNFNVDFVEIWESEKSKIRVTP